MADVFISFASRFKDEPSSWDGHLAKFFADRFDAERITYRKFDSSRGSLDPGLWKPQVAVAIQECAVLLVLLSDEWLGSDACRLEFNHAKKKNKTIILVHHNKLFLGNDLRANFDDTIYDLNRDRNTAFGSAEFRSIVKEIDYSERELTTLIRRIKELRAGAMPPSWPDEREALNSIVNVPSTMGQESTPLAGLNPFYEWQGGAFFGREPELSTVLGFTREMMVNSDAGGGRILPITGPSGVGKSSFLRAGIVARLLDVPGVIVFPVISPKFGRDTNNTDDFYSRYDTFCRETERLTGRRFRPVKSFLTSNDDEFAKTLVEIADALHEYRYGQPAKMIVIPVDQAEELFEAERLTRSGVAMTIEHQAANHGRNVLLTISKLHQIEPRICSILAIRSDFENEVARSPDLQSIERRQAYPLPTIDPSEYTDIIRNSLAVAGFHIKVDATRRITNNIHGYSGQGDPLSLLSLVLEYVGKIAHAKQIQVIDEKSLRDIPDDKSLVSRSIRVLIDSAVDTYRSWLSGGLGHSDISRQGVGDDAESRLAEFLTAYFVYIDHVDSPARSRSVAIESFAPNYKALIERLANGRILRIQKSADSKARAIDSSIGASDSISAEIMHEVLFTAWPKLADVIQEQRRLVAAKATFVRLENQQSVGDRTPLLREIDVSLARELRERGNIWASIPASVQNFISNCIDAAETEQRQKDEQIQALKDQHVIAVERFESQAVVREKELSQAKETASRFAGQVKPIRNLAWVFGVIAAASITYGTYGWWTANSHQQRIDLVSSWIASEQRLELLVQEVKNGDEAKFDQLAAERSVAEDSIDDKSVDLAQFNELQMVAKRLLATRPELAGSWQTDCAGSAQIGAQIGPNQRVLAWCGKTLFELNIAKPSTISSIQLTDEIVDARTFQDGRALVSFAGDASKLVLLESDQSQTTLARHNLPIVSLASGNYSGAVVSNDYTGTYFYVDPLAPAQEKPVVERMGGVGRSGLFRPRTIMLWENPGLLLSEDDRGSVQIWQDSQSGSLQKIDTTFALSGGLTASARISRSSGSADDERFLLGSKGGESIVLTPSAQVDVRGPNLFAPIVAVGFSGVSKRYFSIDSAGNYSLWNSADLNVSRGSISLAPSSGLTSNQTNSWWAGQDAAKQGFLITESTSGSIELVRRLSRENGDLITVVAAEEGFVWLFRKGGQISAFRTAAPEG